MGAVCFVQDGQGSALSLKQRPDEVKEQAVCKPREKAFQKKEGKAAAGEQTWGLWRIRKGEVQCRKVSEAAGVRCGLDRQELCILF